MGKELYLEFRRWRADKKVNSKVCRVVESLSEDGAFNVIDSQIQFLKVGQLVQLKDDDYVPADCILLQTQQETGQCFTQTDALDGERNFKTKFAPRRTQEDLINILK